MNTQIIRLITSALLVLAPLPALSATPVAGGYSGMEFFGSSQVTRQELEKYLSLKPGASHEQVAKGVARLEKALEARHLKANVDVANDAGSIIVSVDVMQTGVENPYPTRKLKMPHHVELSSEVPFSILDELLSRRELLALQGRPVTESYPDGVKRFSDEPCNQYADKLMRRVPDMIDEYLTVISTDPDPVRRSKAVEVLNWAGDYPQLVYKLLPAITDSSEQVRASVDRFIFPRLKMLPPDFPFQDMIELFSLQLSRPSHFDRLLALRCLTECARQHQITLYAIKEYDLDRLKQLDSMSVAASIKEPAHALVQTFARLPDRPSPAAPRPINEF
jgi:hypothetical protein